MMRQTLKCGAALVTILAGMWLSAAASSAHYLWVEEADGAYAVCRGTIGERIDPYDPASVTQIHAMAAGGENLAITRKDEKTRAVFKTEEKPALVAVVSEWGDRVNTTRGKKLMSRETAESEGLTVISAFTSTQFSKTVFASSDINIQPLGMKFELVPLTDPAMLAATTPMSFKLLFDGRPLAGVSILTNHNQEATTDENGAAQFSFEKGGIHLLYATHQTPAAKDSGLDFLKFMTFLTFEVKE